MFTGICTPDEGSFLYYVAMSEGGRGEGVGGGHFLQIVLRRIQHGLRLMIVAIFRIVTLPLCSRNPRAPMERGCLRDRQRD
jgi:hypothetical protein